MSKLIQAVQTCFANLPDGPVGIAVSGGSDSLALLELAIETGREVHAATVDHGLRAESESEAEYVAQKCAAHGITHEILKWEGTPKGNLQAAARQARLDLLVAWAKREGLLAVALGHTLDDQAETVLMRMARGSGVDGLAGMSSRRVVDGVAFVRPLLGVARAELQVFLENRNIEWITDPSNADTRFDRVKARDALRELAPLGITAQGLVDTASRMQRAKAGLDHATLDLAKRAVSLDDAGGVSIDVGGLKLAADELALRLLTHSLSWISGAIYRPRAQSSQRLLNLLGSVGRSTLQGVDCHAQADRLVMARELSRVGSDVALGAIWDGRWHVYGPDDPDSRVAALGHVGLSLCPDWRKLGIKRQVLEASPAVWSGTELRAAPCAGLENGYKAELLRGRDGYFAAIVGG